MDKFVMFFNNKVSEDTKIKDNMWMSIRNANKIGNYLGLLTHIGRSKREYFNFILDRISRKKIKFPMREIPLS